VSSPRSLVLVLASEGRGPQKQVGVSEPHAVSLTETMRSGDERSRDLPRMGCRVVERQPSTGGASEEKRAQRDVSLEVEWPFYVPESHHEGATDRTVYVKASAADRGWVHLCIGSEFESVSGTAA
jgi:hypothetical protein